MTIHNGNDELQPPTSAGADPSSKKPTSPGTVITFYSYKGGTGRSMALANVAWILASNGKRVLALDWDLEAPGLHRFFAPFLRDKTRVQSEGLIEWVLNFALEAATPTSESSTVGDRLPMPRDRLAALANILPYAVSLDYPFTKPGAIDFVSAGRQGPAYAANVSALDWRIFYEKMGGGAFLDIARNKMKAKYDFILIDSRTGVSDTSGVCTVQMPDVLVVCYTANNQSIEGAAGVAASVIAQSDPMVSAQAPLPASHKGPAKIFPVLTRVDSFEQLKLERRKTLARAEFEDVLEKLFPLIEDRRTYRNEVEVPYVPFYAYEETLATFGDTPDNRKVLAPLERLTYHITNRTVSKLQSTWDAAYRRQILAEYEGQSEPSGQDEAKFDVYLSYATTDKPAVKELARRLKDEKIEPWLDEWKLSPGDNWQAAIEKAQSEAPCVAIFLGPSGMGQWQQPEVANLVKRNQTTGRPRLIPVLLPGADSREVRSAELHSFQWANFQKSLDNPEEFSRFVRGIRGQTSSIAETVTFTAESPYPGARPFAEEDARYFFGRARLLADFSGRIHELLKSRKQRAFAVVGPSGIGCSSLVLAGLLPMLRKWAQDAVGSWHVVAVRTGAEPLKNLSAALATVDSPPGTSPVPDPAAVLERVAKRKVLLILDQFEELFTHCKDDQERETFLNHLSRNSSPDGEWAILLAMRDSALGVAQAYPSLKMMLQHDLLEVGPLSADELRDAIVGPVQLVGCEVEPGLVELIQRDLEVPPTAMLILQATLTKLWRRRAGRKVTVAAYQDIGGIPGIVNRMATELYETFNAAQQDACRFVLVRLTHGATPDQILPRPLPLPRLLPAQSDLSSVVIEVIDRMTDVGLLTKYWSYPAKDEIAVEVAHDALVRNWSVFLRWANDDAAGWQTGLRLSNAADKWLIGGRDARLLYTGEPLDSVLIWRKNQRYLTALEAEFIAESEAQSNRPIDQLAYFTHKLWSILQGIPSRVPMIGFIVSLIVIVGMAFYTESVRDELKSTSKSLDDMTSELEKAQLDRDGFKKEMINSQAAEKQARGEVSRTEASRLVALSQNALSKHPLSKKNFREAVLLAVEAILATTRHKLPMLPAAEQALRDALGDNQSRALGVKTGKSPPLIAFSRDGHYLATADEMNTVKIWKLDDVNPAASPTTIVAKEAITGLALAPDARFVVIGGKDGSISYAVPTRPAAIFMPMGKLSAAIRRLTISSDYRMVAVDATGAAKVWGMLEIKKSVEEAPGLKDPVTCMFVNPERRVVVVGTDQEKIVYRPLDGQTGKALEFDFDGAVRFLSLSPDGDWLVAAGPKTARLYRLSAKNPVSAWSVLGGHNKLINAAAFTHFPHHLLMTGSEDGAAMLWDLAKTEPTAAPVDMRSHGINTTVAFASPDGRWTGFGYVRGEIDIWELTNPARPAGPFNLNSNSRTKVSVSSAEFSPDGRWLVTVTDDIELWPFRQDILLTLARQVVAGQNFTPAEWDRYFPGQPYRKTFDDLP